MFVKGQLPAPRRGAERRGASGAAGCVVKMRAKMRARRSVQQKTTKAGPNETRYRPYTFVYRPYTFVYRHPRIHPYAFRTYTRFAADEALKESMEAHFKRLGSCMHAACVEPRREDAAVRSEPSPLPAPTDPPPPPWRLEHNGGTLWSKCVRTFHVLFSRQCIRGTERALKEQKVTACTSRV